MVFVLAARESRAVDSRPSRKEKMQGDAESVSGQEPEGLASTARLSLFYSLILAGAKIGATGFEPATSASRTQRSTRLSHAPFVFVLYP